MTYSIKKNLMGLVTFQAALFLLCAVFISNGYAMNIEVNVDRPGKDYKNFNLSSPDYKLCMQACEKDPNCKAYTYVKPGIQGKDARCWLKSSVPKAKTNTCCVSGVKNVRSTTGPTAAASPNKSSEPSYKTSTVPAVSPIPIPKPVTTNKHYSHVRAPAQSGVTVQVDTDRPGKDYKNFDLTAADPSLCRQACLNDHRCKAFTYVKPGIQGSKARCWLKSAVPPSRSKSGCISGVIDRSALTGPTAAATNQKAPSAQGKLAMNNVDLPGLDYKHFDLSVADPRLCQKACMDDAQCKAYTYVKPGLQGVTAKCWLKNGVPKAKKNNCCISGVKENSKPDQQTANMRRQRILEMEKEISSKMQHETTNINAKFLQAQMNIFARKQSALEDRFKRVRISSADIVKSWKEDLKNVKAAFKQPATSLTPPKITRLECDPPANNPPYWNKDKTVVLGGRLAIHGENFGNAPGSKGYVAIMYDKPTEEFEKPGKLYLNLEPLTGEWNSSWSNSVILVKLPETIPKFSGESGNLIVYPGTGAKLVVCEIFFQGGKLDKAVVQSIKTAPMDNSASLGGTILIEGYNFGRPGKVILDTRLGEIVLHGAGSSGTWPDSWNDSAIYARIPELGKNPDNYVAQSADLEIYDSNGKVFYKMPINFGPKMIYTVCSGVNFLTLAKGDPKDTAKENDVSQKAKLIGPMLMVSHDPGCGWSGNHGKDYFFRDKPLPPNCQVKDFAFAYIHPDDEEWDFLNWGYGVASDWLSCLGTANISDCYDLVTNFFPVVFGGANAGQNYANLVKQPTWNDPVTAVVWDNSCTGPWKGVPVLYAVQFLIYGPENVVPR